MRELATVSIASPRGELDNRIFIFKRNTNFDLYFCENCLGSYEIFLGRNRVIGPPSAPLLVHSRDDNDDDDDDVEEEE